ncbi:hypothetical protein [Lapillicoccus sp.]|uniref:hypothetical protein n=1 Tax=Lapillicoccus sp. TaxID=1909287 RepID=UPI003267CE4C
MDEVQTLRDEGIPWCRSARSFHRPGPVQRRRAPALFNGGDSLAHLWLFIVAPLMGAALAAAVAPLFETAVPAGDTDPTGATVPEPEI